MKPLNQAAIAVAVATLATVAGARETHRLISYMNLLDSNATARQAHETSPVESMTTYGLNDTEQSALLSADKQAVAKSVGIEERIYRAPQVSNIDESYVNC